MRRLSSSTSDENNELPYWQCIIPSVLAKYIESIPAGESLYHYGKIISEGIKLDMPTDKMFRYARFQDATLSYLAYTQSEADYKSMARFYIPIMYSLVKRIDRLSTMTYATLFQQFIRFASGMDKPKDDDELVAIVTLYIKMVLSEK